MAGAPVLMAPSALEDAVPGVMESPLDVVDCSARGDEGPESTVSTGLAVMGTLLVVGASFISCLGTNMQKLSHNHNESLPVHSRKKMTQQWRWWLGIICMILGSIMDMAALPLVPMSRVAALGASGILANVIVTPIFLKEHLTGHDLMGSFVLILGTTLSCTFGAGSEPAITSTCLLKYFEAKLFIFYALCLVVVCAILLYLIEGFRRKQKAAVKAGVIVQTLETIWAHEHRKVLADKVPADEVFPFFDQFGPQFYPAVHAVYGGTVGACSVMFAKMTVTFFGNASQGKDVGTSVGLLFAFLLPTVLCVSQQVKYLNKALIIYRDALFVLPVYQAVWIAAGILAGLIFYQEYAEIQGASIAGFIMGILISFAGIIILARRKSKTSSRMQDAEDMARRLNSEENMQEREQSVTIEYADDWSHALEVSFFRPLAPAFEDSIFPVAAGKDGEAVPLMSPALHWVDVDKESQDHGSPTPKMDPLDQGDTVLPPSDGPNGIQ